MSKAVTNKMTKIKLEGYKCERCGHVWFPRVYNAIDGKEPVICPSCKSPYWNTPRRETKKK